MSVQIKKTGRSEYGQTAKMLVYGEAGAGKTLFGSTAPSPLFLNLEAGLMTLASRAIDYVDIKDATDLQEIFIELKGGQHSYRTVVVDTLDELQKVFIADRLRKERKESMTLQDWGYVGEQMQKALRAYRNLPLNVIFLCHAKTDTDQESGVMIYKPALQGAIGDQVASYVDLATYISASPVKVDDETVMKRVLRFQNGPRFPHVKDRSGKMPPFYELNLQTDFTDILKAIFADSDKIIPSVIVRTVETEEKPVPSVASGGSGGPARAAQGEKTPSVSRPAPKKSEALTPFEPKPVNETTVKIKVVKEEPLTDKDALALVKGDLGGAVIAVKSTAPCSVTECPVVLDDEDDIDLSNIRFRKVLCKTHFMEATNARSSK